MNIRILNLSYNNLSYNRMDELEAQSQRITRRMFEINDVRESIKETESKISTLNVEVKGDLK